MPTFDDPLADGEEARQALHALATRSIAFGRRVHVPGDPKGEHTAVSEDIGGKVIVLGHGLRNRLNPLDEGHRTWPGFPDGVGWWFSSCRSLGWGVTPGVG